MPMSFILVPKNGEEIKINAWNWRPTLELLRGAEIIDDDLFERMGTHGFKAEVDADMASRIADYIGARVLAMKPEQRVLADLTVTDRPKRPLIITPDTKIDQIGTMMSTRRATNGLSHSVISAGILEVLKCYRDRPRNLHR
jgi:hypothetical protein